MPDADDDNHPPSSSVWFVYHSGMTQEDIPDGLTHVRVAAERIEDHAFDNLRHYGKFDGLRQVHISKTVKIIGNNAFFRCQQLTTVAIDPSSQLERIEYMAFGRCNALQAPLSNWPASLKHLGRSVFYQCYQFTHFAIVEPHSQLEIIEGCCFQHCRNLTELDLSHCPLLRDIANSTCFSCDSLKSVHLPPDLEQIGSLAFYQCAQLETISFPATLRMIAEDSSRGCTQLSTLEFASLQTIAVLLRQGSRPFHYRTSLNEIRLPMIAGQGDDDDNDRLRKETWPEWLPRFFGDGADSLLGPRHSEAQRLGCIFSFLQPRLEELVK